MHWTRDKLTELPVVMQTITELDSRSGFKARQSTCLQPYARKIIYLNLIEYQSNLDQDYLFLNV